MKTKTTYNNIDRPLQRLQCLSETVREIKELMAEHNRLVAEGKIPAYKLMGMPKA